VTEKECAQFTGKPMVDATKSTLEAQGDPLKFVKELATYYMDFLETDFHNHKTPKRSVRFRSADNLLVGINLSRYPEFLQSVWKIVLTGFPKDTFAEIRKGAFHAAFPATLLQLIELESDKISEKQMDELRANIGGDIVQISRANRTDYDKALTVIIEAVGVRLRANLLSPFMAHIQKPLERLDLGDEGALNAIEEELCELIQEPARNKLSEIVQKMITDTPIELGEELRPLFQADVIRPLVMEFFSNFGVGDLFLELYELERNKSILDKHEFYLYFCDIAYEGSKYPIFYIPFSASVKEDQLVAEFGSQVYLNKRALEYIVQKENERAGKKGTLNCTADRIFYLAQQEAPFSQFVSGVITELENFFQLDRPIKLQDPALQVAKSSSVRLTNACYVALFDNADEALLNDYEQILQLLQTGGQSVLGSAFKTLIDDFIYRNPDSVEGEVNDEWDAFDVPDRLVHESPVPLNSEQRQILMALQKEHCKYITVDGPPGTGKSHTITAIVCNSVLNNQSVLVLSDKKEALDVVEEKISSTLNRVRKDKNFQNPILRLGSTGSTYAQILSAGAMEDIRAHYRAVRRQHESLQQTISSSCAGLKEDIEAEAIGYGDIALANVMEWAALETRFDNVCPVDSQEVLAHEDAVTDLEDLYSITKSVQEFGGMPTSESSIVEVLGFAEVGSIDALLRFFKAAVSLEELLKRVEGTYPGASNDLGLLRSLSVGDINALSVFLQKYAILRKPLIGYLLSRRPIDALDHEFRAAFGFASPGAPHGRLVDIERIRNTAQFLRSELERLPLPLRGDGFRFCHTVLTKPELRSLLRRVAELAGSAERLPDILTKYPSTMERLGISATDIGTIGTNHLTAITADDFAILVRYISIAQQLRHAFHEIPEVNYAGEQDRVHALVTLYMTYLMDGRVIKFDTEQKNTAKTLRDIIRSKQRFPQAEFLKLKDAFPCILSGVRDYAEYIPLVPEIFDLLIIDEASQVSIAQAFPALLRAKKILILGDKKQFSNVKASQAGRDTNNGYMSRLGDSFRQNISRDTAKLVKLERFNIHTSILEFFEFISNYHAQLLKHSRSYKELISYSNTAFYKHRLQVMKIRGKNIDDVIRFTILSAGSGANSLASSPDEEKAAKEGEPNGAVLPDAPKNFSEGKSASLAELQARAMRNETTFEEWAAHKEQLRCYLSPGKIKELEAMTSSLSVSSDGSRRHKSRWGARQRLSSELTIPPLASGRPTGKNRNINQQEAQFIISELLKLKEQGSTMSVGIITPHTDQQKLLVETIGKLPEREFLYSEFRLKIMTFDTCQGEERDLIFYSMVADSDSDKLWGVFIKDLQSVNLEEDGKIKAQRLNVGFSRAKEGVHFVLSKSLDSYNGAVGEALRHFWNVLTEAKKEHTSKEVDPRSEREAAVLEAFYQTRFWIEEKDRIEFTPQFELGRYLKQIDPNYLDPEYRVDFLLLYHPEANTEKKIIIEYDGFKEHFGEGTGIDASNYSDYYSEEDVYRQKVLESYGYKFLRINRFNFGENPIATIDARLRRLVGEKDFASHTKFIEAIHSDIRKLQGGELRECPKCKEVRDAEDFNDASLASGVGRFCKCCKGIRSGRPTKTASSIAPVSLNICPKCGSRMLLRSGRYGRFYGCSKYPYCRATRQFDRRSAADVPLHENAKP
jgi:very-short-patch-repair endonuclease